MSMHCGKGGPLTRDADAPDLWVCEYVYVCVCACVCVGGWVGAHDLGLGNLADRRTRRLARAGVVKADAGIGLELVPRS